MEYDLIIGIDPDVDKNGFARYFNLPDQKELQLMQLNLFDTFNKLLSMHRAFKVFVRLESGHRVKKTWQKRTVGTVKNVARNNEIGSQIEKFLIDNNIPHELVDPFGGSKINHQLFCKITGWDVKKKTNPETRVAGLLAFYHNLK